MNISRRIRLIVGAGALPGTAIAAFGDFFSPKGGWILPLLLGIIAAIIFLTLLLLGTKWLKKTSEIDSDLTGWWDGPVHLQPGVLAIGLFAICGIVVGFWSHARSGEGGVAASNLSAIADAQSTLGVLNRISVDSKRTADAAEKIRDSVKRETSEDPFKELANLGIPVESQSALVAQESGNERVLKLLSNAKVRLDYKAMKKLFDDGYEPKNIDMLSSLGFKGSADACDLKELGTSDLNHGVMIWHVYLRDRNRDYADEAYTDERIHSYIQLCGSNSIKQTLKRYTLVLNDRPGVLVALKRTIQKM